MLWLGQPCVPPHCCCSMPSEKEVPTLRQVHVLGERSPNVAPSPCPRRKKSQRCAKSMSSEREVPTLRQVHALGERSPNVAPRTTEFTQQQLTTCQPRYVTHSLPVLFFVAGKDSALLYTSMRTERILCPCLATWWSATRPSRRSSTCCRSGAGGR